MLSRIVSTYLGVIVVAHAAELLTSYNLTFFAALTLVQVIGPALLCRCARRQGRKEGRDEGHVQGYIEGRDAAYSEIRSIAMESIERAAHR